MVISRAMNAPTGTNMYDDLSKLNGKPKERAQFFASIMRGIHEGWRYRLGISLPVIAQYIKILVVHGILFPKILASLYFVHWTILELFVTLARYRYTTFTPVEMASIVDADLDLFGRMAQTDELIEPTLEDEEFEAKYKEDTKDFQSLFADSGSDEDEKKQFAHRGWPYDLKENLIMYLHLFFFIILGHTLRAQQDNVSLATGITGAAIIIVPTVYFLSSDRYIVRAGANDTRRMFNFLFKGVKRGQNVARRYKADGTYGGFHVGGDLGIMCLILWCFYCAAVYDSAGTSRPSWPWLDILG